MKTLILLVLVLSNGFIFAQNWSLVNPNRTVFYKHSDSLHITNTIKIDSLSNIGQDTTYYAGYAFKYCDTCQGFSSNYRIIYRYAKELLGIELTNDITNNQYVFDNNIIKQNAQLNDSWVFNANLSATVVATNQMSILGVLDSVKTIELSNNDTIIISKNYGVIRYPDFENAGKYFEMLGYHEGQNSFGEYLPNFWRTYDFNVGDKFFYSGNYIEADAIIGVTTDDYQVIYEILNDLSTTDSVKYLAKINGYYLAYYGFYKIIINDTILLTQPFNTSASESIFGKTEVKSYFFMGDTINNCSWPNCSYSLYKYILLDNRFAPIEETADTNNYYYQASKPIYSSIYGNGKRVYYYFDSLNSDFLISTGLHFGGLTSFYADYFNNFGRVRQSENYFEATKDEFLTGAIINGDTLGTVFTIPDDIGLDEYSLKKHLTLYPNPATHQITVNLNYKKITIFNNIGENVMSINQKSQTIDVSELPDGLYFIIVTDLDNNSYSTKFIKQ